MPIQEAAHVYSAAEQPLTKHFVEIDTPKGTRRLKFINAPTSRWRCSECGRRRQAKNLVIQVYYDMSVITCAGGCAPTPNRSGAR